MSSTWGLMKFEPFADPSFRTKRIKTAAIATCAPSEDKEIQLQLPYELYSSGGSLTVKNAEIGDYFYCEVEDIDGVIPEAYRSSLCEAWPIVATYVIGQWVEVQGQYTNIQLNTHPLIAKLTSGLYLCFHYVASSEGVDRKIGVNYFMYKKL